jgi:hypothetical protein
VRVHRLLTILSCTALAVLAPSVVLAQAVPWNTTVVNGTVVSVDAATLTVRDEQGFLRQVSLGGAPRTALAPGMAVTISGYRDSLALQAIRVEPRLAPPAPAVAPIRSAVAAPPALGPALPAMPAIGPALPALPPLGSHP